MSTGVWRRVGLIAGADAVPARMVSHIQCPIPFVDAAGRLWLYFTSRDEANRSHPFRLELDRNDPTRVLGAAAGPLLSLGERGCFDSRGVMPGSLLQLDDGRVLLYYVGWNVPDDVPFHNSIGLAVSSDGGRHFERASNGPVLDRSFVDPLFVSTPHVQRIDGVFRMWYLSGTKWAVEADALQSFYQLKEARSTDGIRFATSDRVVVAYDEPAERALASPTVLRDQSGWRMWFSARRDRYRIMNATSSDGESWDRVAEPALAPSDDATAFDSEQTAYPAVIALDGRLLMFYNGNAFGRTGAGLAEFMSG